MGRLVPLKEVDRDVTCGQTAVGVEESGSGIRPFEADEAPNAGPAQLGRGG